MLLFFSIASYAVEIVFRGKNSSEQLLKSRSVHVYFYARVFNLNIHCIFFDYLPFFDLFLIRLVNYYNC